MAGSESDGPAARSGRGALADIDVGGLVADYERRCLETLEAGNGTNTVFSSLGVWLVLALAAGAAPPRVRREIEHALGCDADAAHAVVEGALALSATSLRLALAAWANEAELSSAGREGFDRLPEAIRRLSMPSQHEADAWTATNTMGLISTFPADVTEAALVLASALATKVRWREPFKVVPAGDVLRARSAWSSLVDTALRAHPSHRFAIYDTASAERVATHVAPTGDDVAVMSVIGSPEVDPQRVRAAGLDIVAGEAAGRASRLSLFDLDLGDGHSWTIQERRVERVAETTVAPPPEPPRRFWRRRNRNAGLPRVESYEGGLVAWSAKNRLDLASLRAPGIGAALAAVSELVEALDRFDAVQAACAEYTSIGFEAAAVTAIVGVTAAPPKLTLVLERTAKISFDHPYAVLAYCEPHSSLARHFDRCPLFNAWVSKPEEDLAEPSTR